MKVLVTGGTGFIGSHVVNRLTEQGHEPVIFDRHLGPKNHPHQTILGDVRDAEGVTDAVAHVEGVIHLAGVLGTAETVDNPRPAAETNVLGALNVFQAVRQYQLPAVNIAVGNWWFDNPYSISKNMAERFALMFNREHETRIAVVRALNAYGPGQTPSQPFGPSKVRKIMPALICRALCDMDVEVMGDGMQLMDMVHVRDVARVLVNALTLEHGVYDRTMDCGTGRPTSVNQIAHMVIEECKRGRVTHIPMRPGETPGEAVLADTSTLPKELADGPFIDLEAGIPETVKWLRETWAPRWES